MSGIRIRIDPRTAVYGFPHENLSITLRSHLFSIIDYVRHVSGGWENFFDVFPTWKLQLSENFWKLKVATHVADFVMSDLKLFLFFLFLWKNYTKLIFNGRIFLTFVWSWKQPERGQEIYFIKSDFRLREFKLDKSFKVFIEGEIHNFFLLRSFYKFSRNSERFRSQ